MKATFEIINKYRDAITDLAAANCTESDLTEDQRRYVVRQYLIDASVDERQRVMSEALGDYMGYYLAGYVTETLTDSATNNVLDAAYTVISKIVEDDIELARKQLDPPDTITRAMDAKEREQDMNNVSILVQPQADL